MSRRNGRLFAIAAAAIAALALSACGGGPATTSGEAPRRPGGPTSPPPPPPPVLYTNLAPKAEATARTAPVFAKQSEGPTGWKNVYGDYFTVFMTSTGLRNNFAGLQGSPPVSISADSGRINPNLGYVTPLNSPYRVSFSELNTGPWRETWRQEKVGSLFKLTMGAVTNEDDTTDEVEAGEVAHLTLFTDYEVKADADTDYMAVAVWDMGPKAADHFQGAATTAAGAIASGPVPDAGLADTTYDALTSVSYSGTAGGKRFRGGKVEDFTTTVTLTANFDTDKISGSVANVGDDQKLVLGEADIAGSAGGQYSGNTKLVDVASDSTETDVANFTGKWGGAFYGTSEATKGPPGTAGTFGASISATDNNRGDGESDSILGVYIAHR